MANSKVETQVTWSAASSVTVSSSTVVWSDSFAFNADERFLPVYEFADER